MPRYFKTSYFWLGFGLLIALGGVASWLMGAQEIKESLAYGYGAPEVISRLLSQRDDERGGRGPRFEQLRMWWAL